MANAATLLNGIAYIKQYGTVEILMSEKSATAVELHLSYKPNKRYSKIDIELMESLEFVYHKKTENSPATFSFDLTPSKTF